MAGRIDRSHQAQDDHSEDGNRRLRFELIFGSIWLAVGLFVVPALIFWVGLLMLGPYGEGQGAGLGTFYGEFFGDLANGEVRTWSLALGPFVVIALIRALFIGAHQKGEPDPKPVTTPEPTLQATDQRRREPRIEE